ncbi:hypothetical protein Mp_5g10380 [Marchantia polymorpha subsp. ruderalis]|uniref:RNA-dependent RNA polymerase n=2 Tax=Marchantia polymorpha TaxID=3197 RepID=A0AAF6BGX5_MARPO|nr:hypothetical protein MARPO_0048s0033 [Marchantia polymorpha]BBN11259.1 hypothetical protein Mp_5g10380 [Marchantia polymorpha subsp. ruderalis]|eukprot:PTQ38911.1 hypothetical protein MARPO_0048s0033 [Marchantia polymorpha]
MTLGIYLFSRLEIGASLATEMWSFMSFTSRRKVESDSSESSETLSREDAEEDIASSSEDTFEDCSEEPEVCSSADCTAENVGLANLSIYPPLSSIASQAVSMDRECPAGLALSSLGNFSPESYASPAKRIKSYNDARGHSPAGVLTQAAISWASSPDTHSWHGGPNSSVERVEPGFASAPMNQNCQVAERSPFHVTQHGCRSRNTSPQEPPYPRIQDTHGRNLNQCNSKHPSGGLSTNHSSNVGPVRSLKGSLPADRHTFLNGVHRDGIANASSDILLPGARDGNYGSNGPTMQFGISQVRSNSSLSADIHYELRDGTSVSSGVPKRAVKTVAGPIGSASYLFSPGSNLPRKYAPSTGYCVQETINENAAPCVLSSFPRNSSEKSEPVSSTGLLGDDRFVRSMYGMESVSPPEPGKYTQCGRRSVGAGVLHGVKMPWSSLDELIDQSLEEEFRPENHAPQVVLETSGVPTLDAFVKPSFQEPFQKRMDEPILDDRKDLPGSSVEWPQLTEHLHYLGTLDFSTQVFPILTSLRGKPLEKAFTLDELRSIGTQPKEGVCQYLWYMDGLKGWSTPGVPPKRFQPDTSNYTCRIKPTGQILFELVDEKKQAKSLVHRTLGFDKVLKVAFEAEVEDGKRVPLSQDQYSMYCRLAKNGIFVGCRRYQYFAHKASDKFEKKMEGNVKCFFVCTDSRGEVDLRNPYFRRFNSIAEARTLFMHIHQTESIAKFIARMQLILSKTMTIDLDWTKVVVREKMDLQCQDGISTDGTGFISTNLARIIPTSILNGRQKTEPDRNEDYPSLSQVRVLYEGAAYKGTLLASEALPPNTIKLYKSMKKVGRDDEVLLPSVKSLEIVSTSQKPRKLQGVYTAKLSRDLIILLTTCGVPGSFFIDLVKAAIEDNHLIFSDYNVAMNEVLEWETEKTEILLMMINARIPLTEPFLHRSLLDIVKRKLEDFTTGKVNLPESFYLMGTADPTGTLKRNQVAIVLSDGPVYCPKLLVYRAPGKHPGDIHVFEATCNSVLQKVIGSGKYVIYFSTQGPRPIAEEIGKGDLDGDRYWVCKNTQLVSLFKEYPSRWAKLPSTTVPKMLKPADLLPDELEETLFKEYMKARFSSTSLVGKIANLWLKHMDQFLHSDTADKKALHFGAAMKFTPVYYNALDASKAGYTKTSSLMKPLW